MKRFGLLLIFVGILLLAACDPDGKRAVSVDQSDVTAKTEAAPKEEVAEAAPAVVVSEPVESEPAEVQTPQPKNPIVKMITNRGQIDIELYADKAPITVANFLDYVNSGFYNGTVFHRVISGFMIQGGGMTESLMPKPTKSPIKNESYNKVRNTRGMIAMARTNAPDSATSQFFINHVDNRALDFDGPYKPGYAVFGKVIKGMDVVDAIAAIKTKAIGPHANVPVELVKIESVTVME